MDVIDFINGWLDAQENSSFKTKILFIRYEDLIEDENAYWNSILNFYNIERSLFKFKPFKPQATYNPLVEGELHNRNSRDR
jgi:hypothetical protein